VFASRCKYIQEIQPVIVDTREAKVNIQKLHHIAYRCRDAEETRKFYEDILGLPLVHVIQLDKVPSTGEPGPFAHLFFEMDDGSYIAFFDLGDGKASVPDKTTPSWLNHLAVEVENREELNRYKSLLTKHGIEVVGPTDHEFVESIYFFDPNGIRLELTTKTVPDSHLETYAANAHAALRKWMERDQHPA
jgi:catechol 2,3-dioxygenase-like lactoylglutathione lyase family enzyme